MEGVYVGQCKLQPVEGISPQKTISPYIISPNNNANPTMVRVQYGTNRWASGHTQIQLQIVMGRDLYVKWHWGSYLCH